jgi:hypothetical protein
VEEETYEGYVDNPKYIHLLQEGNNTMHLTHDGYEDSLSIKKQIPKSGSNGEVFSSTQYMIFFYALKDEMHKKYDIRPRNKSIYRYNQPKTKKFKPSLSKKSKN